VNHLRLNHPDVPVIYFANGGSRFLKDQIDIVNATAFSLDWHIAMKDARGIAGPQAILCGNLNPRVLFDDTSTINKEVKECIESAGYTRHVFNVGDGIVKTTEEESVRQLVDAVKSIAHPVI
jgi:uroporphyrinogen decarboxylase